MKTAAVYCRVSTEDQEREGSSLDSQLEACLKYAGEHGYDTPKDHMLREVRSGLTLDRPEVTRLRDWVRDGEVDAVIVYSTDRLSRDPLHLLLLAEEHDKRGVALHFVTEPLDNTMEGQLLGYVRGWASKLEAIKIRERTMRGAKARALAGKLPNGRGGRLYGYLYIKGKNEGQGIRIPNEDEAEVVKQIYSWLVEEGLSINAITKRLRSSSYPPPESARTWSRSTVHDILCNPAYCGRTYAFRESRVRAEPDNRRRGKQAKNIHIKRPPEEWIEIPNATPAIISESMFEAAQGRLQRNRELASRNTRRQYLLRGFVKCRSCGRIYAGVTSVSRRGGHISEASYYRCRARTSLSPVRCTNRTVRADYLDQVVWEQIEALLANPEIVMAEVERRQEMAGDTGVLERNLDRVRTQLASREKQKARVWKAFELTGDEDTFKQSIGHLQKETEALQREESRLQKEVEANTRFRPDPLDINKACQLVRQNLKGLSLEDKRQALEALDVRVWVDGDNVEIEGAIPIPELSIVSTSPTRRRGRSA